MNSTSVSKRNAARGSQAALSSANGNNSESVLNDRTVALRPVRGQPKAERVVNGFKVLERGETRPTRGGRRKMTQLSKKQQDILHFIEQYIEENNWPPTVREIQEALKISSTSVVDYNLDALETKGQIVRKGGKSRAIELVNKPKRGHSEFVPMLGTIAAGSPIPVIKDHDPEDQVEVPSYLLKGKAGPDIFALRVKGDSMIDALIADGDIVLIRAAETAEMGETVAVWLESEKETTLKKWYPEPQHDRIRLQPANSTMQPIYTTMDNARVKGKLVGVIRSI
jgi:repressor LexA